MISEISGELGYDPSVELLGKSKFGKWVKKAAGKVGKYTRPFTSAAARSVLGPQGAAALASLDPTKKGGKKTVSVPPDAPASGFFADKKNVLMIAGAGILGLILLSKKR